MRSNFLLLLVALAIAPASLVAQPPPRIIQCEECTPEDRALVAVSLGQTFAGAFYVFSLERKQLERFWVDYDHAAGDWVATPVQLHEDIEAMFGHMLEAYAGRPEVFSGREVFQGHVAAIGGSHDPVAVAIHGRHDSHYGRFIAAAEECLDSDVCVTRIDPVLGAALRAERAASKNGFSLFLGRGGPVAWEWFPPRLELRLCTDAADCALLEYQKSGWEYVDTRAESGSGKAFPLYRTPGSYYSFDDAAAAARFERSLHNAGARLEGAWKPGRQMFCETDYETVRCEYQEIPGG